MKAVAAYLGRIASTLMVLAAVALALGTTMNLSARASQAIFPLTYAGPEHSHVHGDGVAHSHAPLETAAFEGLVPEDGGTAKGDHEHEPFSPFSLLTMPAVLAANCAHRLLVVRSVAVNWPEEVDPSAALRGRLERPPRPLSLA